MDYWNPKVLKPKAADFEQARKNALLQGYRLPFIITSPALLSRIKGVTG